MADTQHSFLIVRVAECLCALPVGSVTEVLRMPSLTGGGGAVPGLLGVATLRGEVVPVLELAVLMRLRQPVAVEAEAARRLVAVRFDGRPVALAVDAVLGVRSLAAEGLTAMALPGGMSQRWARFDAGLAQLLEQGGLVSEELWTAIGEVAA